MFEKSSIYVMEGSRVNCQSRAITRLCVDEQTRKLVCSMFDQSTKIQIIGNDGAPYDVVPYDPDYTITPDQDECMCIDDFVIPSDIETAIKEVGTLEPYRLKRDVIPSIRAVFVCDTSGTAPQIAFQRFRSQQYLSPFGFHLFFGSDTAHQRNATGWNGGKGEPGITISSVVDCFIDGDGLKFKSSFYANQIFDLSQHLMAASDEQVQDFMGHSSFQVEDLDGVSKGMGVRDRKKIASIMRKNILTEHNVDEIKGVADQFSFPLNITPEGKIEMPSESRKRRELLAFLDEDIYRGSFSDEVYLSNSKRARG